jgi:dTDP-4-dehydrorhamnose reductase
MFGQELVGLLESRGLPVRGFDRTNLDLEESPERLASALVTSDVIVNAVAYTKVDLAESEPEFAYFANAVVPGKLARASDLVGARLIHISTDYVFDGITKTPYQTYSEANPMSVYGKTKLLGEDAVLGFENTQVVRTSWLYGRYGKNFAKTIAGKLLGRQELRVVDDQIGSPTHTLDLAEFVVELGLKPVAERVLHGVSSGSTSWFGFAQEIARSLGVNEGLVLPTDTASYPTAAPRPAFSVLEPSVLPGYRIGNWKTRWQLAASRVLSGDQE